MVPDWAFDVSAVPAMTDRRKKQCQTCLVSSWLVAAGLAAVLAGCSHALDDMPAEVIPVEGTLTYRGQPVPEAQLTFRGDDRLEPAFAITDANGKFHCMTNDSSAGMPPGDYVVTIANARGGIPEKYTADETTPLRVTVEESGENRLLLELED